MYINMSDIDMELRPVEVNNELVYVTRCGDLWRWKRRRNWSTPKFRKIVTKLRSDGYIRPKIGGKLVALHRIVASAFLGLDTSDTKIQVDHISGVRHDNRLENLRLVNNQQNSFNTKALGYCWSKQKNKWQAYIKLDGRLIHLGLFDIEEDARDAYMNAKLKFHKIP